MTDIISRKLSNDRAYAYHAGAFWAWDEDRQVWKESVGPVPVPAAGGLRGGLHHAAGAADGSAGPEDGDRPGGAGAKAGRPGGI